MIRPYDDVIRITNHKRKRAQYLMPVLLELMKEWSVSLACHKAGLHYQSYLHTLKEFDEFNEAYKENLERRKKAKT